MGHAQMMAEGKADKVGKSSHTDKIAREPVLTEWSKQGGWLYMSQVVVILSRTL